MASIFRPKRKVGDPVTGKTKSVAYEHWYIKYRDASGIVRKVKGFTDKVATRQRANELERQAELGKAGVANYDVHGKTPLTEHLEAFRRHLDSKGNTAKHSTLTRQRIAAVFTGCGIVFLRDLDADKVADWLADQRQGRADADGHALPGMSIASGNHYAGSVKSFGGWLVKSRRWPENPFAHLVRLNAKTDVRHERRALSAAEMSRLIEAAERSRETFRGLDGTTRAMLYRVATMTGLRASELASLTPASFDLAGDTPTVTIEAAYSKHRREDVLPVHPDLAARLRQWLAERGERADDQRAVLRLIDATDAKRERLFAGTWPEKAATMLRVDLDAAGIPYNTDAGIADFHSLRHTFVSNLAAGGVHPKIAQQLARHSTIALTMDRYTHVGLVDMTAALDSLPTFATADKQTLRATGTDDTNTHQQSPISRGSQWDHSGANSCDSVRETESNTRLC